MGGILASVPASFWCREDRGHRLRFPWSGSWTYAAHTNQKIFFNTASFQLRWSSGLWQHRNRDDNGCLYLNVMTDINSLSHSKWNCKYHIIYAPRYRRQVLFGKIKADVGKMLRQLCEQEGWQYVKQNREFFGDTCTESEYVFVWCAGKPFRPDYITRTSQKVAKDLSALFHL